MVDHVHVLSAGEIIASGTMAEITETPGSAGLSRLMSSTRETLLDVQQVSAGYGDLTILHSVSLQIGKGEVVGLLGANGAGKSTLVRTIGGHLRARIAGSCTATWISRGCRRIAFHSTGWRWCWKHATCSVT